MVLENKYIKSLKVSHTYLGLFAIIFFYISAFFGTITVLKPYINTWESPSKHFAAMTTNEFNLDVSIPNGLETLNNPTNKVTITLPSATEKAIAMKYGFSENIYIDPNTSKVLDTQYENSLLSNFFNTMHINVNMSDTGQLLMGITSIAIVFLTISGVYLWLLNRKKRAPSKNFWFRWHKDLSLVILPYIIIFSLTGAVLGIMLTASSPFAYSASQGKETSMAKLVRPVIFVPPIKVKQSKEDAKMEKYSILYKKAQDNYENLHITEISLFNWNDKNARIVFSGYLNDNRILTSRVNRVNIVLNGETAQIVRKKTLDDTHEVSQFLSAFYFFHFITDEDILLRIIYIILGIIFTISLVFGLFIWIGRKILKGKNTYFNIITKLSTAFTIGMIPASTSTLFLYWVLPFSVQDRDTWIIGGFYTMWSFTFLYSVYKKDALDAAKDFLYLNALLLILAVLFHGYRTDMFLWDSYAHSIWDVFYMDLFFLLFGIGSFVFAKNINKIKFFDKFKGY